jgi:RNA polymerase sigma factor (sigma-70 family)
MGTAYGAAATVSAYGLEERGGWATRVTMRNQSTQFSAEASDRELIAMILNEEDVQAAWDALLTRYSNLIYSVPLRYGLQESDANDVYQGVCESLWKELAGLRDPDRLDAWLLKVAGRLSWRAIMNRRRKMQQESVAVDAELPLPDSGPRPDDVVMQNEEWRAVAAAVRALSNRCQELIWYLYYDPAMLSYEDIATHMGLAEGSIGPIRVRCLARLKKQLDDMNH